MAARWLAFVIWAAVAAMAAGWALRLLVPARSAPAYTTMVDTTVSARGDLTRLFGVEAPPPAVEAPPPDTRFKLVGVAAPRAPGRPGEGLALIAVDGKPARAFRVGATVEGETVLQEVRARGATLGPRGGAARVSLEIPPLPPPATGTMPIAAGPAMPSALPGGQPATPPAMVPGLPPAQLPGAPIQQDGALEQLWLRHRA
jgi:general secretion pathway protein C